MPTRLVCLHLARLSAALHALLAPPKPPAPPPPSPDAAPPPPTPAAAPRPSPAEAAATAAAAAAGAQRQLAAMEAEAGRLLGGVGGCGGRALRDGLEGVVALAVLI